MSEPSLSTCTQCGGPIAVEDLHVGLAVRVDGQLVCGMCVDTLPGEAVVRINRMRALKGLEVTTYLVPLNSAPKLQLYSFTTSANITNHRHKLVADGFFEAPNLPPPGQRVVIPPEPKRASTDRVAPGVVPGRKPMLLAAAATVIIIVGIAVVFASLSNGKKDPATTAQTGENAPLPVPMVTEKTRLNYSTNPYTAWEESIADKECPLAVKQAITEEIIRQRSRQLDAAEEALAAQNFEEALRFAAIAVVLDDFAFRALQGREAELLKRIESSRTLAATAPKPAHKIEPLPQPLPQPLPTVPPAPVTPPPTPPVTPPVEPTPAPAPVPTTPAPVPEPAQPPAQQIIVVGTATMWQGEFITASRDKKPYDLPLDGSEYIPDGWPSGMSALVRSSKPRTLKRHGLFLDLKKIPLKKGGVALLLHPMRGDRKSLSVHLTDGTGKTFLFPPIACANSAWLSVALPIPSNADLDTSSIVTLGITDAEEAADIPEDSGFILGKVVLVNEREPTIADLGLRPSALAPDDDRQRNFPKVLDTIARNRKRSSYKRLFETDRIRAVLAGPWATQKELTIGVADVLKNVSNQEAGQAAIIQATLSDAWLDTMAKGRNAPLDPTQTHLALWWTGGSEMQTWPDAENALNDFWKQRISNLLDAGILPIIVIGPNSQRDELRTAAEIMWQKFSTLSSVRLNSIPVIDLRALTTAPDGSMDATTSALAVTLIGDALSEINYLLRRQGAVK